MNETEQLAEYIAGLRFEDLSPEAVANAKLAIIDTVGVATFGSTLPWSRIVADVGQDIGATGKSSIWGRGWQTAPSIAALVNGTAAHAVEMDDRHHKLNIHNGGTTVPAAIALAESTGASGRELVLAVASGYEVAFRVARASMKTITKFYWVSIRNIWGSVGASAKILGLDKRHTMSAFGIAGGMASGLWEFKNDPLGTMSKRVQGGGWPSQSGVMAALLAQRGLTGPGTILEGEYPDRVRSLTLACTACRHFGWRRELLAEWADQAQAYGMREFVRRNLKWMVGPRSLRRTAPAMAVLGPLAFNVPVASFVAQVQAILNIEDSLRTELTEVTAPTLVLCGSQDVLTTQGDSEEIASLIPGAELAVVRGGAHLFMVEQAAAFNRTVVDFLDRTTSPDRLLLPKAPAKA